MAKRNKDLEIVVKLLTSGNFDEAKKQLDKLKEKTGEAASTSATTFGTLQSLWKAWTNTAVTSASVIRKAWLTALGPISALIIIFQTLKSTIGFVFTAISNYRKAQEETNKTVNQAADALGRANLHKERYADAKSVDKLTEALKLQRQDLENIGKSLSEITKKTEKAGQQWFNIGDLISANNRKLMDQLPALAQAEIELKKEIIAREKSLELAKKQEEAEKKRLEATQRVQTEVNRMSMSDHDFKLTLLSQEVAQYERAGVDRKLIDEFQARKTNEIWQEVYDKMADNAMAANKAARDAARKSSQEIQQFYEASASAVASSFAEAFAKMIVEAKTFEEAAVGAIKSIEQAFIQLAAQEFAKQIFSGMQLGPGGALAAGLGLGAVRRVFGFAKGGIIPAGAAVHGIFEGNQDEAVIPLGGRTGATTSRRALMARLADDITRGQTPEARRLAVGIARLAANNPRISI